MSTNCISCHKSTRIDNGSFLLECIQCNTFWHHRCHRPPVPDKDLAQVLTQFTQDRKLGVKNAKVQWTCINCVNSKGKAKESQSSTGREKEKEAIVIDEDDEIESAVGDGDRTIPPTTTTKAEQQHQQPSSMPRSLKAQSTKTTRSHTAAAAKVTTNTSHVKIDSSEDEDEQKEERIENPRTKSVTTKSIAAKSRAKESNFLPPPPGESSTRQNPSTITKSTKTVKSTTTKSTTSNLSSDNTSNPSVISHNARTGIAIIDDPLVFPSPAPAAALAPNPASGSSSAPSHFQVPAAAVTQKKTQQHALPRSATLTSSRSQSIVAGLNELSMSTPEVDSYPPSSHRSSPHTDTDTPIVVKQEQLDTIQIDQLEPRAEGAHGGATSAATFVPTPREESLLLQDWVRARHRVRTANEGPDLYDRVKQHRSAANKRPRKVQARSLVTIQSSSPTFITSRGNAPLFEFSAPIWKNEKIQTIDSVKF